MESPNNPLLKALLPHLFYLRRPTTDQLDSKLQLQIDSFLLDLFSNFLKDSDLSQVPELDAVREAFRLWADLQSKEHINLTNLSKTIKKLKNGQHLPLLLRAQNLCIILSVPALGIEEEAGNNGNSLAAFSSGGNSVPSRATLSTFTNIHYFSNKNIQRSKNSKFLSQAFSQNVEEQTFEREYPDTSVRVEFSSIIKSSFLAEQIFYLDKATIKTPIKDHLVFICI